ncbi:MAG: type II toxin-antitoxin system Phd/YefM family antitoxin [Acidobacteriaceae bacterium]|nr:type II toxin-antitoxin system Phd/YefM family antitoxin [Acidobacteriaceae bacterium]MBV9936940.1 type II toxin-antitoxin system Phd/YefM family antitoxin [Acidobacteriaceae bacterium]
MKTIPAGAFKTNCLALMDEVQAKRESLLITKHGKPVAKLVPIDSDIDDIFGFYAGKIRITGDIIEPTIPLEEWGEEFR